MPLTIIQAITRAIMWRITSDTTRRIIRAIALTRWRPSPIAAGTPRISPITIRTAILL
ncbi:MAG TPA: hypothetical protein VHV55_14800 [Pirellulales bacterium]|nr:hypothetical protein [Pirellulales bacterium]